TLGGLVFDEARIASLPERLLFLAEVLVFPALLGMLFGWNLSNGWNNALLRRLSMPVQSPIRRAHDFAFGQNRPPGHVILNFQDGTIVYGFFGPDSLAASDPNRSDIYLERIYTVDEDGNWIEPETDRSAIISLAGLRSVEFLDANGGQNGPE
ncbi:MAG: DUF6338 family protein, partial [Gemmobacter sp.]